MSYVANKFEMKLIEKKKFIFHFYDMVFLTSGIQYHFDQQFIFLNCKTENPARNIKHFLQNDAQIKLSIPYQIRENFSPFTRNKMLH